MSVPTSLQVLLIIPLYNHGATVAEVVQRAGVTGYPVVVVDDGSSDGGISQLEHLDCFTLRLDKNRGKGAALRAGAAFALERGYDAMVTIDADGQHDPGEAGKLVREALSGAWPVIVIGSRQMTQDTVPGSSRFGREFSNFWVRLECGLELSDTQSGMRLYPVKEFLQLEAWRNRYDFEIEVLVKAVWSGIEVRSIPVSVHYPPAGERVSHFNKIVDNWRLTLLHTALVSRRLMPVPHKRLVPRNKNAENRVVVRNPWQTLKNLCKESASPFWLAVAVWFGIFIGALPLIACHTVVIIYVMYRFRLNKVAAVAASQFCMPPVVPVLCIETGYYLRSGELLLDLSWERWLLEIHYRLWDWFLGSLLVGPLLGLFGAVLVYYLGRRFAQRVKDTSG